MNSGVIFGSFIILILGEFLLVPVHSGPYEMEPISFESFGDDDRVAVSSKMTRISRGVFGITANITILKDTGNEFVAGINFYRSPLGTDQYKLLPIGVARGFNRLDDFINNLYKPYLMTPLKDCSDLPQIEGEFKSPVKAAEYHLTNCQGDSDLIPDYFQPGEYKTEIIIKRADNSTNKITGFRIYCKITKKSY